MAGMGGNYYAALGMSVAENTGAKELQAANEGLKTALTSQIANQNILRQANTDLSSIFDSTQKLAQDIQTDQIEQQKLEEDKASKELMANEAYDKANEATMQLVNGYQDFLKGEANQKMQSEIVESITGNKDINKITSTINNVIDNLDMNNYESNVKDSKTGVNIKIKDNPLKDFDKNAIREYMLNTDKLLSDRRNGLVTDQQYAAITVLQNKGGLANAVRQERDAIRTLDDIKNGIKTPAMYQREAQILKETNPFFFRDKDVDTLARELSFSKDISTGRFDGKSYKLYEEFEKSRELAKYDTSNIGNTVNKPDIKDTGNSEDMKALMQMFAQFLAKGNGSNTSTKSVKESLDKAKDNVKIDIFTGKPLPEYEEDKKRQEAEITTQTAKTKKAANKVYDSSIKLDDNINKVTKDYEEGKITKDEYEQQVFTAEQGRKDAMDAMALNSTNAATAIRNVDNSPLMKKIKEHVIANKDFNNIITDDKGNISPKHEALLDSIDINELRDLGRQLISIKDLMQYEISSGNVSQEAIGPKLNEINQQIDLINSLGKTKVKLDTFKNSYDKNTVNFNEINRKLKEQPEQYKDTVDKLRSDETNNLSREKINAITTEQQGIVDSNKNIINNGIPAVVIGVPYNDMKTDSIQISQEARDACGELYKGQTGNDRINYVDGKYSVISMEGSNTAFAAVKLASMRMFEHESANLFWKDVMSSKDSSIVKYKNELIANTRKLTQLLDTTKGVVNAQVFGTTNFKNLMDNINSNMNILIALMNKSEGIIHTYNTKSNYTISSEQSSGNDMFRKDVETMMRFPLKEKDGRLVKDEEKTKLSYQDYMLGMSQELDKN